MRIKNLNNDDISTMLEGVALRYRVKCDDINIVIIRQTLQAEFSNLLVNDFNQAFIKHCSGRFMIDKEEKNNKPYGDLSAQFICVVIKKYKEFMHLENSKPKLIDASKQLPMSKESKEEMQKKQFEMIEECFNETKEVPLLALWSDAFQHMHRIGLIKLSESEVKQFRKEVTEQINSEVKNVRLKNKGSNSVQESFLKNILESRESLKKETRKRFIIKYYEGKC